MKIKKIAIITPYYDESDHVLEKCMESVRKQTVPCVHFMVGDGKPRKIDSDGRVVHLPLPVGHDDFGDTPRAIGAISAVTLGYDAIAFLDADNWYYPYHIEYMIRLHEQTGAAVCTATRNLHRLDESLMHTDSYSDGKRHVDTSCFFLTRPAFRVIPFWAMKPKWLAPLDDHIFFFSISARRIGHAHCEEPTVAYRTAFKDHYERIGENAPPGTKDKSTIRSAFKIWNEIDPAIRQSWQDYFGAGGFSADDEGADLIGPSLPPVPAPSKKKRRGRKRR